MACISLKATSLPHGATLDVSVCIQVAVEHDLLRIAERATFVSLHCALAHGDFCVVITQDAIEDAIVVVVNDLFGCDAVAEVMFTHLGGRFHVRTNFPANR